MMKLSVLAEFQDHAVVVEGAVRPGRGDLWPAPELEYLPVSASRQPGRLPQAPRLPDVAALPPIQTLPL